VMPEGSHLCSTVTIKSSVPNYSKAPRGLFVQVQVGRIFTAISISPGNGSRQSLSRSTFRAGRNFNSEILKIRLYLHAIKRRRCSLLYFRVPDEFIEHAILTMSTSVDFSICFFFFIHPHMSLNLLKSFCFDESSG